MGLKILRMRGLDALCALDALHWMLRVGQALLLDAFGVWGVTIAL
jgi:hypothetical protein